MFSIEVQMQKYKLKFNIERKTSALVSMPAQQKDCTNIIQVSWELVFHTSQVNWLFFFGKWEHGGD